MKLFYKFIKNFLESFTKTLLKFKEKHPALSTVIVLVFSVVASLFADIIFRKIYGHFLHQDAPFVVQRLILLLVILTSIILIFYFGKKGREFAYKFRYLLGAALFVLCVAMQINYSSSGALDAVIQPNFDTQTGDLITGRNQSIRSDEYVVNTPMLISQYYNDLNLVNPDIMADDVITSLYPKAPNRTPLSLLSTPQFIGFAFLPLENAFSFYQLLPWFVAFFAVFEMLMVFTKKRKLMSFIGSLFIIFNPVVLWFECIQYPMYVALLFDIFYLFIKKGKSWKSRLGFSILFGWIAACFAMMLYPAWQLPFGYVLLALLIYLLVSNRHELKWKYLLYAIPVIGVIIALVLPNILLSFDQYKLTMNTVYPGQRFVAGGGGLDRIFYYVSSIFFPIVQLFNPCEASGFIGLFPIPLFIAAVLIIKSIKKKKFDPLLISLFVLGIFFSFMLLVGNDFIARISFLYLTPSGRLRPVVDFVCVLIIIRILSNYQTEKLAKNFSSTIAIISAIVSAIIVYFGTSQINYYSSQAGQEYMTLKMVCIAFVVFFIAIYCLLINCKKTGYVIGGLALIFSIYDVITVFPFKVGLDAYMDKPVAVKIRELSSDNQETRWIAAGTVLANYALANDARVINSTNYYPVLHRWQLFDKAGENEDIYNRYAHININITDGETEFELASPDVFILNVNRDEVCLLNPTHLLTTANYEKSFGNLLEKIYYEDGIYIYHINCPETLQK